MPRAKPSFVFTEKRSHTSENRYNYLNSVPTGAIPNTAQLEQHLVDCWHEFSGNDEEGMTRDKLYGRIEKVRWNPPILTFVIERHGSTVLGSKKTELHDWKLNVNERTALCYKGRFRQLYERQAAVDTLPMAEEVVKLILDHQEDKRLKWNTDGSVRVHIGKILPERSAVQQTLTGRRKRFRKQVEEMLSNAGWQKVKLNVYAPPLS